LRFVLQVMRYMHMFDTHCHLNFKIFKDNIDAVIKSAQSVGMTHFVVPGTDIKTSKKAVEIAQQYGQVYAAVGIHPHHVFDVMQNQESKIKNQNDNLKIIIKEIKTLMASGKVVAIGEIGLDKHHYATTKYEAYHTYNDFINIQKFFLIKQLDLARKHNKSVILHNREAKDEFLKVINENWEEYFRGRMVLHCCEADDNLLDFAIKHEIFIGVDGDVTFSKSKQEFIKKVPLDLLVLETDSPFLLPEPLKSQKKYPNVPANLIYIIEYVARLMKESVDKIAQETTNNGKRLFNLH